MGGWAVSNREGRRGGGGVEGLLMYDWAAEWWMLWGGGMGEGRGNGLFLGEA
jgi:hypothetical protein